VYAASESSYLVLVAVVADLGDLREVAAQGDTIAILIYPACAL
jgi:hypothetical protein